MGDHTPVSMLSAEAVSGAPLPLPLTPRRGRVCVSTPPGCSRCSLLKELPGVGGRCFSLPSRGSVPAQVLQKFSCWCFLKASPSNLGGQDEEPGF